MTHRTDNPDEKWCVTGQHFAPRSEFNNNRTSSDGLQKSCRECDKARNKTSWLSRRFSRTGWTEDEYTKALKEQGGGCAVCGSTNNGRALCADHDHKTGQIRRLLCDRCNQAIGLIDDDPNRAEGIANYLRGFRS